MAQQQQHVQHEYKSHQLPTLGHQDPLAAVSRHNQNSNQVISALAASQA
jgi:hypothetical protein